MNRKKISSAAELTDNFDLAAVRGYFLGGSLSEWLRGHGGEEYADKLDKISETDPDLNARLAEVFGKTGATTGGDIFFGGNACVASFSCVGGSFSGSAGSGMPCSLGLGFTGALGSFGSLGSLGSFGSGGIGSFFLGGSYSGSFGGSGSFSRFSLWEWEWEWRFGRRSSYSGSFHFGSGAYFLGSFGGFGSGGSFSGSFGSFSMTAFGSSWTGVCGSFGGRITPDEYDRIMYECLRRCPLDRYGYGIHVI